MKCEDLQFNLSLYADDDLAADERTELEAHLSRCPVCRAKNAEFVSLRNNLRVLSRPQMPANLMYSVRSAIAVELNSSSVTTKFAASTDFREWLQYRLMPYGVGTFASLLFAFLFLTAMLSTKDATEKVGEIAMVSSKSAMVLTNANRSLPYQTYFYDELNLTGEDFAALRIPVSAESPSLNPKGAFLALTKSLMRGKINDDEVVVVADVFSDGLARIAEVVEAPRSRQSLADLEKALENDPRYAPFVPAKMDNRSSDMRVVLKILRVDVVDTTPAAIPSKN